MRELLGTGVALVTPFKNDKSVDFKGLERLVNFQIDNGVNYMVVLGTTGESVTLTKQEKIAVFEKVKVLTNRKLAKFSAGTVTDTELKVTENLENLRPKSWHWIKCNIDKNKLTRITIKRKKNHGILHLYFVNDSVHLPT